MCIINRAAEFFFKVRNWRLQPLLSSTVSLNHWWQFYVGGKIYTKCQKYNWRKKKKLGAYFYIDLRWWAMASRYSFSSPFNTSTHKIVFKINLETLDLLSYYCRWKYMLWNNPKCYVLNVETNRLCSCDRIKMYSIWCCCLFHRRLSSNEPSRGQQLLWPALPHAKVFLQRGEWILSSYHNKLKNKRAIFLNPKAQLSWMNVCANTDTLNWIWMQQGIKW